MMTEMSDKDFKAAILKVLQWTIINMHEINKKSNQSLSKKNVIYKKAIR